MEGVPRIPMIGFPLKRSADVPDFKSKIKRFIAHQYHEDPEAYNQEIANLESLRAGATHVSRDFTGCATLKKYFCQLNFLKSRFPFHEGSQIATSFSWYDAYSDSVHGWKDIDFEMACILYNIGALHSELGTKDPRVNADGMKTCCTHFQCAAWAFQHLKNDYHKYFSPDLSSDVLSIMTNICLAQAQECILEKSLIDNRKSAITAKVSLQIVEYYQQTLKTIEQILKKSSPGHSEKVIKAVKKWKDLVETKAHYYACLAYLYRGLHSEEQSRFGERITFFKAGVEQLNEAIKCAKNIDKSDASLVAETLNFTADVIGTKLTSSEKENEFVYHEKVPELNAVDADFKGVSLVKGIPFKFDDPEVSGPDIFSRLVPMEAHEASSLYSEEKAKILRTYSAKVEEKNAALERFLLAMQLEHLDVHSDENTVPQELVDCCASLSVNPEAVKKLSSLMSKLSGMFHDVEHNLKEINELLKADEAAEKEFQEIVGKRPPNNVITELSREVKKYQQAHSVASESNQTLHEAMRIHVVNLQILMKPFPELLKSIPSIADAEFKDEAAINEMKRLRSKIDEMRNQREMLKNQLRDSILNDDITKILVVKQDQDLESVFQEELKKHEKITQLLDQNLLAQDNILRAVTEANAAYAGTRKATEEVMKKRNQVIQDLLSSYDAYNELLIKCTQGVEFYTKLDTNVSKLLQRVRSTCKVLEEEREERANSIIKKAPTSLASDRVSSTVSTPGGGTQYPTYSSASPLTNEAYNTSLQSQLDKNSSMQQQQYEANLALQKQYEANLSLQQQYEKNMALQKEYEELTRLQQQIASVKESTIKPESYNSSYSAMYSPVSGSVQSYAGTPQVSSAPSNATAPYYNAGSAGTSQVSSAPSNATAPYYNAGSAGTSHVSSAPSNATAPYYNAGSAGTSQVSSAPSNATAPYYNTGSAVAPQQQQQNIAMSSAMNYLPPTSFTSSYVPSNSSGVQTYGMTSSLTQPYMATPMPSQSVYPTSSAGIQSYTPSTPANAPAASEQQATSTVNTQISGGIPSVPVPSHSASMNTVGGSQYNEFSNNPLLQQYSQQYGQGMNMQSQQDYGAYPILGQQYSVANDLQPSYGQMASSQYSEGMQANSYVQPPTQVGQDYPGSYPSQQYAAVTQQQQPTYAFSKLPGPYPPDSYNSGSTVNAPTSWNYTAQPSSENSAMSYPYSTGGYYDQASGQITNPMYQGGYYQQEAPAQQQHLAPTNAPTVQNIYTNQQNMYETAKSQESVSGNVVSSATLPVRQEPVQGLTANPKSTVGPSNVDLLAGVDVSLPDPPLQPLSSSGPADSEVGRPSAVNSEMLNSTVLSNGGSYAANGKPSEQESINSSSAQENGENSLTGNPLDVLNLKKPSSADKAKPTMDHLSDPTMLEKFKKDVENLEHTFEGFYRKSLNGPTNLDMKWKEVIDKQNTSSIKMDISVARCYPMKNRYPDILPYDQTRVPLPCTKDEYINASFVREISPSSIPFVATQAPLPVTFSDFWHMVWYHQVELIACLINDVELKDHIYWPLERGKDLQFGPLTISLQAKNVKPSFIERIFCITNRDAKQTRVTIHLQFKGWTGNVFPDNPAPLLQFVNEVHNFYLQQRSLSRPVVVHCISGVGKTGVFLILSAAIRELQSGKSFPDLTSIAGIASEQRKGVMNDKEYLRFAYQCLLYYCQDLLMKRGILSGRNQSKFEEKKKPSHSRHPSQDFLTEAVKNIVSTEGKTYDGEQAVKDNSSTSLPCTPVHRVKCDGSSDVVTERAALFSDVPASLLDVDASTFHALNRTDVVTDSKRSSFEVRKGALLNKPDTAVDPLDALDPLWTMKK